MKKVGLIVLLFSFLSTFSQEQKKEEEKILMSYEFNYGFTFGNNELKVGAVSDQLLNFGNASHFIEPINLSVFYKNFGAGINVRINFLDKNQLDETASTERLNQLIGDSYFIKNESSESISDIKTGTYNSYYFGIQYRYLTNKFQFLPSFYVGSTEIDFAPQFYKLKEEGGNDFGEYYINHGNYFADELVTCLSYYASMKVGYQLNEFLYLQANLQYNVIRPDFIMEESLDFELSDRSLFETYKYNEPISNVQLGFGVFVLLNNVPAF